jgi:type II secretory pathway pseudopilin PulG
MVVLVLIGILSAMIIPEMKGTYADALLRSSGRELVNVFKLAYSEAISRNQIYIVRLDRTKGHFVLERRLRGQGNRTEFAPVKDVSGSSGDIDSRITVEVRKSNDAPAESPGPEAGPASSFEPERQPDDALTFYPDGTADAAEVLLRDQAGFGLRLRIDPITARVEIFELAREQN